MKRAIYLFIFTLLIIVILNGYLFFANGKNIVTSKNNSVYTLKVENNADLQKRARVLGLWDNNGVSFPVNDQIPYSRFTPKRIIVDVTDIPQELGVVNQTSQRDGVSYSFGAFHDANSNEVLILLYVSPETRTASLKDKQYSGLLAFALSILAQDGQTKEQIQNGSKLSSEYVAQYLKDFETNPGQVFKLTVEKK